MWGASAIACIGPGMRSRLLRLSRLSCSVTKVRHRATLYSYFRGEFTLLRSWAPLTCSMLGAPINFTNSFTANTCNDIVKEERVGSVDRLSSDCHTVSVAYPRWLGAQQ